MAPHFLNPDVPQSICIVGGYSLQGETSVPTDKITLAHLLPAATLSQKPTRVRTVHLCEDVISVLRWMEQEGIAKLKRTRDGSIIVTPQGKTSHNLTSTAQNRSSICLLTPLAIRQGSTRIGELGGCSFAERKIDRHLALAEAFGVHIRRDGRYQSAVLKDLPPSVTFSCKTAFGPSVGVTCHGIMTALVYSGEIVLLDYAREPVVETLIRYLILCTGRAVELTPNAIHIASVGSLDYRDVKINVPYDLNVAFTLIAAALATGGTVLLRNVSQLPISITNVLRAMKVTPQFTGRGTYISTPKAGLAHPVYVECKPWPGLPSDCGPLLSATIAGYKGSTTIHDYVYKRRSSHVNGLLTMGYNASASGNKVLVRGKRAHTTKVRVQAPDIRAGAALVIAALAREGKTRIDNYHQVHRGYEDLLGLLGNLGANISPK